MAAAAVAAAGFGVAVVVAGASAEAEVCADAAIRDELAIEQVLELAGVFRPVQIADVDAVAQNVFGEVLEAFAEAAVVGLSWGLGARGVIVVARCGSELGKKRRWRR